MLETIKSYLVSLGFAVDNNSYNQATKAMDNAEKSVAKFAGGAVTKFAIAGSAVTSFVAAANIGIAKFIGDLAQADLANEKLARQMWTSKDNAAAYNNTLKAMGVSLQDLYLSPELMRNFQTLRDQSNNMRAPKEFNDQMKMIRSIQFEFTRMKLEATYALQWIGYYFIKYMGGPLGDIKKTLGDINNTIVKTMPTWTKVIAQVMSWFARMGITTVRAFKDIGRVFDDIGKGIPKNLKLIGAAVAALALIIQTGPIGIITALIIGVLLLLDDFYTYLGGGESVFGSFWKKLDGFVGGLQDKIDMVKNGIKGFLDDLNKNGTLDNLKQTFINDFEIIKKIIEGAKTWVTDLFAELKKQGVLDELKTNFEKVLAAVSDLSKTVTGMINDLLGLDETKKTLGGIGAVLNDVIIVALKTVSGLVEGIAATIKGISSFMNGSLPDKLKKSGEGADKRLKEQSKGEKQGVMEGLWQTIEEMLTDSFTGKTNFRDKLLRGLGTLTSVPGTSDNPNNSPTPNNPPAYIYPQSNNTQNSKTNKVSLTQTNNIYGSDAKATADAAQGNLYAMYTRNMRGMLI